VLCAAPPAAASRAAKRDHGDRFVHVLVKLRTPAASRALAGLDLARAPALHRLGVRVVNVPLRRVPALSSRLSRAKGVEYVERDRVVMRVTAGNLVQATPTDPLWSQQWGAVLTGAPTAWAVTKGSPSVVVAVLDTGVDSTQPDLEGALVPGYDFVNNDADPADDFGHGTGVAGIVAARADNGLGVSGYCPRCSVMPVKVAGADGQATEANVASGITWAADHGARVINLSLGGSYGATVASAVDYATGKGAIVVAAAGNNGNSNLFYPAADAGVLSVAGTQPSDQLYSWSNFGSWVAVAAPGCAVTTVPGGSFGNFCGTSASTPAVSGLAGLAISFAPSASASTIEHAITSSARPVTGTTYGRIEVAGTLAALGATFNSVTPSAPAAPATPAAPAPTAAPGSVADGLKSSGSDGARSQISNRHGKAKTSRKRTVIGPRAARAQRSWTLRLVGLEPFGRRH
jgi:subtilisin family serine protease